MTGKISEMSAATTLDGTEPVEVLQGGVNVKIPAGDIGRITVSYSANSLPASPTAGLSLFARNRNGLNVLSAVNSAGGAGPINPMLRNSSVMWALPNHGASALSAVGLQLTSSGTITTPTPTVSATPSYRYNGRTKVLMSTGAAANAVSTYRASPVFLSRQAGFRAFFRFGVDTIGDATMRYFVGLVTSVGAFTSTQDPDAQTNCIIFGANSADTNLQMWNNDGSGTATKADLGANFPGKTAGAMYEALVWCDAADSSFKIEVRRTDVDNITPYTATLSTDIPATSTLLNVYYFVTNVSAAAANILANFGFYIESAL